MLLNLFPHHLQDGIARERAQKSTVPTPTQIGGVAMFYAITSTSQPQRPLAHCTSKCLETNWRNNSDEKQDRINCDSESSKGYEIDASQGENSAFPMEILAIEYSCHFVASLPCTFTPGTYQECQKAQS